MAKVKVWNDNPHTDWVEKFKGDEVKIPRGQSIEMEFYEAHEFKGQFSPIKIKADGTQDPRSHKMIRVEALNQEQKDEVDDGQEVFQCNMCKKIYTTETSLIKHSEAKHSDHIVTDPDAEQSIPKKRGRPAKSAEHTA
jgi:hypothetical protein